MAVQVPSRLYRSRSQKMIAGVSGGLGEYFDVDPVLIRLLFVVTTFISGVGLLAYVVLWIVVPLQGDEETPRMDALRRDFDDISSRVRDQLDPRRPAAPGVSTPVGDPLAGTTSTAGTNPTAGTGPAARAGSAGMSATTETGAVSGSSTVGFAPAGPTATSASAATGASRAAGTAPIVDDPLAAPFDSPRYEPPRTEPSAGPADPSGGLGYDAGAYGPRAYEPSAYEPGAYESGPAGEPRVSAPYAAPFSSADRTRRRQHWAGAILIVLGVLFLAQNLGLLWWVQARFVWPLALVGIGAWLLFGRGRRG